jgi:hypothetical protein
MFFVGAHLDNQEFLKHLSMNKMITSLTLSDKWSLSAMQAIHLLFPWAIIPALQQASLRDWETRNLYSVPSSVWGSGNQATSVDLSFLMKQEVEGMSSLFLHISTILFSVLWVKRARISTILFVATLVFFFPPLPLSAHINK